MLTNYVFHAGMNSVLLVTPILKEVFLLLIMEKPLKKLFLRRFNQTILIAKYLCKTQPKKLLFNFLLKKFDTLSQASLDYQQRTKNLKNSFILNNKHKIKLDNKVILLLDDVTTTNSTLNEAHLLLDKLPVKKIILVTFAKSFT